MKIAFTDFWPGFKPNSNFFIDALRSSFSGIKLVSPRNADVIFHSVFGEKYKEFNSLRILYTGENISYKNFGANFALSFMESTNDLKNFRFPLWMLHIKWFKTKNYGDPNFLCELESLMNPIVSRKERHIYLAGIFNHDNAENRLFTMSRLMKMGETQFFGSPFGNHFRGGQRSKIKLLKKIKFNLCFENSDSFGYHTEKLIQAKISGCVPIYWANSESTKLDFNLNSFLFIKDPFNQQQFEEIIGNMNSKKYLRNVLEQPLFNSIPKVDPVLNYLSTALKSLRN